MNVLGHYLVSVQLFQTFWSLAFSRHVVLTFQLTTMLRVLQHALGIIWFPCRGMQNRNMLSHKISHQTVKMLQGAENHLRQHHKSFINFTAYASRATSNSIWVHFSSWIWEKKRQCVYTPTNTLNVNTKKLESTVNSLATTLECIVAWNKGVEIQMKNCCPHWTRKI